MPKPLSDGLVDYADGSPKTVQQYGKDVAAFLMWAAEPKLDKRRRLGFSVLIFLIIYAGLLVVVKKKIWSRAEAKLIRHRAACKIQVLPPVRPVRTPRSRPSPRKPTLPLVPNRCGN